MSDGKKLWALLIGVGQYADPHMKSLAGPENDVRSMQAFLRLPLIRNAFLTTEIVALANQMATKQRIVEQIRLGLSRLGPDDVFLLYFSGHGCREKTLVSAFQQAESDETLENVLCYDFDYVQNRNSLADKELRFLFFEGQGIEKTILAIFDCCHSGDNTRGDAVDTKRPGYQSRWVQRGSLPPRKWEDFCFASRWKETIFQEQGLKELIPITPHYHLAACRDVELAWEFMTPEGVERGAFTFALLTILQEKNLDISYRELARYLANYMWQRNGFNPKLARFNQTPQLTAWGMKQENLNLNFLTQTDRIVEPIAWLIFNISQRVWRLSLGFLHGMSIYQGHSLKIKDPDTQKLYIAQVKELELECSYLHFIGPEPPRDKSYQLSLTELITYFQMRIFVEADPTYKALLESLLLQEIPDGLGPIFNFVEEELSADFSLHLDRNRGGHGISLLSLRKPKEANTLLQPIQIADQTGKLLSHKLKIVYKDLYHIAQWQRMGSLTKLAHRTVSTEYPVFPLSIWLTQKEYDKPESVCSLTENNHTIEIPAAKATQPPRTGIRIGLRNDSQKEWYCALLVQTQAFGTYSQTLERPDTWLAPGEIINSHSKLSDPFWTIELHDHSVNPGQVNKKLFLHVLVATEQFDPSFFDQEELPTPHAPFVSGQKRSSEARPLLKLLSEWSIRSIELRFVVKSSLESR